MACKAMSIPNGLLQLQRSFYEMMDSLNKNPKVADLMNTTVGKYLNEHPFLALTVLVFGAMATVPIGGFLIFATITFIAAAVGFILLEAFLLSLGGVTLLCLLCGLVLLALLLSSVISALYITASNMLNLYCSQRSSEEKMGEKLCGKRWPTDQRTPRCQ